MRRILALLTVVASMMVGSLTYSHESAAAAATYNCVAAGPDFAAAESGLTKKEAQDFKKFYERQGASVKCTKNGAVAITSPAV